MLIIKQLRRPAADDFNDMLRLVALVSSTADDDDERRSRSSWRNYDDDDGEDEDEETTTAAIACPAEEAVSMKNETRRCDRKSC